MEITAANLKSQKKDLKMISQMQPQLTEDINHQELIKTALSISENESVVCPSGFEVLKSVSSNDINKKGGDSFLENIENKMKSESELTGSSSTRLKSRRSLNLKEKNLRADIENKPIKAQQCNKTSSLINYL